MSARRTRRSFRPELVIEIAAVAVTFVMMLHIAANAALRTWWDRPIDNTLELVQYWYLPLVAFLGFIAAQHRGQHIAADVLYEALPSVTKRYALALMFLLCSAVSVGFAWYGWREAVHAFDIRRTAGVSAVPAWPTYFLVPLAFGSLTIQFLLATGRALRRPDESPDDAVRLEQIETTGEAKP